MNLKFAIASNKNFCEKTLPIVVPSMIDAGIDPRLIHVFIGGYDSEEIVYKEDYVTYHYLNHNSYEYSPLIEIVEKKLEAEYWFLVHDTCKFGPRFKELVYSIPENRPEKVAIKTLPAMSIGSYRYDYLLTVADKLMEIKNKDYSRESMLKWKTWGCHWEDYILWRTNPTPSIYNGFDHQFSVVKYENWYGTDTVRRTEYFPSVDLYKNKSNWGQTNINEMVITI